MHEHTCIECDRVFECDGDVDLNWHDVMVCDRWTAMTALCPECDKAPEPERERDADDGLTYADPRDEMEERLLRD